jgi:hypothetical protein
VRGHHAASCQYHSWGIADGRLPDFAEIISIWTVTAS